mmetsp:Transcript_10728/g.29565  ORF Transcript_10728/g.29565 Transcript_10728/m.29565 type:complete len:404 (+) Transcript_10728:45-1256(+)
MKFGKQLRDEVIQEWRFYSVDYKDMKKSLKTDDASTNFFDQLDESEKKLLSFYQDKQAWATQYWEEVLKVRVEDLRQVAGEPNISSDESLSSQEETMPSKSTSNEDLDGILSNLSGSAALKEEYRRMGESKHFKAYIYAKKSLTTFDRELGLLVDFFALQKTAFGKILKKYDKRTGSSIKEQKMGELSETLESMECSFLKKMKKEVTEMIDEVNDLKPKLPRGWENRKVYTIGCFDLFHRGHQNVLMSLREFGCFIVAGIHSDEAYVKLKKKTTIDKLETRMKNVKPFVDQIYVIPSTDPQVFIENMVSQQDIDSGACCYARGDDMTAFPSRPWVESVMPIHFVPRTENCSSTLIRTIYHAPDESLRKKAAFAKTRYDGKPVDENGNVLKLSVTSAPTVAAAE